MAPLMAPKIITPWTHTLLHRRVQFKVVECWQLGGVYKSWILDGVLVLSTSTLGHIWGTYQTVLLPKVSHILYYDKSVVFVIVTR